jgi:hypothetical protein
MKKRSGKQSPALHPLSYGFLALGLFFRPEDGGDIFV